MIPADPRAHLLEFLGYPEPGAGADPLERLDSLGLLKLVVYLEETYGISLVELGVEPDDLRSVEGVLSIVRRGVP